MAELYRGARRARHAIADHMGLRLNERISVAMQLDPETDLVPVAEFHPVLLPMPNVTNWPVLMVKSMFGRNLGREDFVDGQPLYRWDWVTRTFVWARGESYKETTDRVEAIADAVMTEMLARPGLSDPESNLWVRPETMNVSLSSIEPVPKMRASIAGAFVEAVVTMAETAPADPPHAVGDVDHPLEVDLVVEPKDP